MIGTKGSIIIRFDLEPSISCVFSCSHLESGEEDSNNDNRFDAIGSIRNSKITDKASAYNYDDHDVKFIFGDLNFRVSRSFDDAIETLDSVTHFNKQEIINDLLESDQLGKIPVP